MQVPITDISTLCAPAPGQLRLPPGDLAVDHCRPDGLLAAIVRRRHARMTQVRKHFVQMLAQEVGQPPVALVCEAPGRQTLVFFRQTPLLG